MGGKRAVQTERKREREGLREKKRRTESTKARGG